MTVKKRPKPKPTEIRYSQPWCVVCDICKVEVAGTDYGYGGAAYYYGKVFRTRKQAKDARHEHMKKEHGGPGRTCTTPSA